MASLEFDQGVNALYLRLRRGRVSSSEPLADNMILDFDTRKNVVGLELLLPAIMNNEVKARLVQRAAR